MSSQTWGFQVQCLYYKPVPNHFCSKVRGGGGRKSFSRGVGWLWIGRRKTLKIFVQLCPRIRPQEKSSIAPARNHSTSLESRLVFNIIMSWSWYPQNPRIIYIMNPPIDTRRPQPDKTHKLYLVCVTILVDRNRWGKTIAWFYTPPFYSTYICTILYFTYTMYIVNLLFKSAILPKSMPAFFSFAVKGMWIKKGLYCRLF